MFSLRTRSWHSQRSRTINPISSPPKGITISYLAGNKDQGCNSISISIVHLTVNPIPLSQGRRALEGSPEPSHPTLFPKGPPFCHSAISYLRNLTLGAASGGPITKTFLHSHSLPLSEFSHDAFVSSASWLYNLAVHSFRFCMGSF
jgi:hypothetical protein